MVNEIISNVVEAFKGDNGPAYAGIFGIALIVCSRYGYRLIGSNVTLEPAKNTAPIPVYNTMDSIEEVTDEPRSAQA